MENSNHRSNIRMVVAIKFSSLDGFEEGSLRVSSADSTERESQGLGCRQL